MQTYFLKAAFFIAVSMLFSTVALAQEQTNKARLEEAKKELEIAVDKQDFAAASGLQKEIEIREKIEEAIAENDFEEALRLKEKLTTPPQDKPAVKTATNVPVTISQPALEKPGVHPPSPGKAVIYFASVSNLSHGFNIFHEDKFIGINWAKTYFRFEISPGKHLFWAAMDNEYFMTAEVEAGSIYLVIIDMLPFGTWKPKVKLSPVSRNNEKLISRARELISEQTPFFTPEKKMAKQNRKLEKKDWIAKILEAYKAGEYKEDHTYLTPEMAIPIEVLY